MALRSQLPARFTATTTRTFLDIRRTLAGTSIVDAITLAPVEHGTWTLEGDGTMTVNSPTSIDLMATATGNSSARVSFATEAGKTYALTFTIGGQAATVSVGSIPAAIDLNAGVAAPIGTNTVSFTAVSSISHVKFTTTVSGSLFLSDLAITETVWATGGPGTVTNQTATTVSINAVGGTPTFARRALQTVPGENYTVSWTSNSVTGTWAIGSAQGLTDIAAPGPSFVLGANSPQFTATSSLTYLTFQRTGAGTVDLTGFGYVAAPLVAWTGGGTGSVTVTSDTSVTLTPSATGKTYARRTFATVPNRKYALTATFANNSGQVQFGTTAGGGEIMSLRNAVVGNNPYEFVSDTTPTHLEISRSQAGSATVTGLTLTELSTHPWYSGGAGTINITSATQFTLTGVAGSTTFVHRPIPTVAGREYIWTFTVAGGTPGRQVGSGFGGANLAALANATVGANSVRFAATNFQAWVRIQMAAVSSAITISNIAYSLVPLELATAWTISGTGTTSVSADQTISITGNGTTATQGRRSYNTVPGQAYELLINVTGQPCAYFIGTSDGGAQVVAQTTGNPGTVSIKFTATSATSYLTVQRTGVGTTVITRPVISLTELTNTITPIPASFNDNNLGGIGHPYYYVDRLSDSATDGTGNRGSLRYCLSNNIGDKRLILSEVQGVVTRTADLGISAGRNNITIAGFTGPGPIVLQGSYNFGIRGQFNVIEHLCFEREYNDRGAGNGDAMQIISSGPRDVNHILIRNCAGFHSQDEAMQIFRSRDNTTENQSQISLHWSIFSNALKDPKEYNSTYLSNLNVDAANQDGDHNFGILIGGYIDDVDIQRNLMANFKQRSPRFSAPQSNSLVANNVIVNWGYSAIGFQSETDDFRHPTRNPSNAMWLKVSIIGNIGIPGPDTTEGTLIAKSGSGGVLGDVSLIHISGNSIIQGLNAAVTGNASIIGSNTAIPASFPGNQATRQDTLTAVTALAQAKLLQEMELNAGPFPKLRAQNSSLMVGVSQAIAQMKNEIAGKMINHEAEGPGLSKTPFVKRSLTGDLAPPADHTNVEQVKAWLQERRLEVSYGV